MEDMPPVRYAKSDEVHIAYVTAGEGPEHLLVTPGLTGHVEGMWRQTWLRKLAQDMAVTWFDKRGAGASDSVASFTFEERMDDLRAVMDAAGIESAHLAGLSEGGPLSILFAAGYPERVRSLTLYGTYPALMRKADYPHGLNLSMREYGRWLERVEAAYMGDDDALLWYAGLFSPTLAPDPTFRQLFAANLRRSASPGAARAIWEVMYEIDVRHLLSAIRVPTTVVHYTGDRVSPIGGGRYLASHIPGAKLVELPGEDHAHARPFPELVDAVRENVRLAAEGQQPRMDRRVTTVLFTDIVDSTPAAARAGDRAWRETLDRHDAAAKSIIAAHGGRLVKSTGDGLLATFDGPSRAVRAARALHAALGELCIPIRAGLHAGEIEVRGDDIAGMAVHIAARVSGLAGPGETLVSSTVKDLVVGAGFTFTERGEQALKGIEQPWRIYALEAA